MASDALTAYVQILPSFKGMGKNAEQAMSSELPRAADRAGRTSGSRFSSAMTKGLKRGAVGAGLAITGLIGTGLVKGFGRLQGIENATAKLDGLGHSAESVQRIMDSALASVKGTAFGLDEAATAAATAVAAGVKPGQQLQKYLTLVGDAATQTNTEFAEMARVLNKARTLGGAYNDTLQVLAERGLPVYQMLSKELGVSTAEVKKLASEGAVSAQVLEKALGRRISGAAQKSGKTLAGAWRNSQAALGRLGASVLKGVYPQIREGLGQSITELDKLGPAAERVGVIIGDALTDAFTWAREAWPDIKRTGETVARTLIPPLKTLANLAVDAGKFLAGLPGPVKELGVQAGIAALILPRMTGAAASAATSLSLARARAMQFRAELTYMETRSQRVAAGLGRLGGAARSVAGVGGMVALAQGAQSSDRAVGTLLSTLGGAAAGFAIAGPIGGAVGALGGLATEFFRADKAADAAAEAWQKAKPPVDELQRSLKLLSGAATASTRAILEGQLQEKGAIEAARNLGVSTKTLVNAVLGKERATLRVAEAMAYGYTQEGELINSSSILQQVLYGVEGQMDATGRKGKGLADDFQAAQRQFRRNAEGVKEFRGALKLLPRAVRVELKNLNYEPTRRQVRALRDEYDLSRRQVRTIFKAVGIEPVRRQAKEVSRDLAGVGKVRPNLGPWHEAILGGTKRGERTAKTGSDRIAKALRGSSNAKFDPGPLLASLSGGIESARGTAATGGSNIGAALSDGAAAGVRQRAWAVADEARNMVANALRAANNAAQVRSPSRKTRKLGVQLGDGLRIGIASTGRRNARAAGTLVDAVLNSVREKSRGALIAGARDLSRALGRGMRGAGINAVRDWARTTNAALKDFAKIARDAGGGARWFRNLQQAGAASLRQMRALGKQYDQNRKKLQAERDQLQQMRDMASGLRDSLRGELDLGSLLQPSEPNAFGFGGGTKALTFADISSRVKALAGRARTFAARIRQMRGAGIPAGLINEVASLGSVDGIAVANALLSGTKAQFRGLQADWGMLQTGTQAAGNQLAKSMFGIGIRGQQGLINGLLREGNQIDRATKRLADRLVRSMKKSLGIRSPSRLVEDQVGRWVGAGLGEGMLDGVQSYGDDISRAVVRLTNVPRLDTSRAVGSGAHGSAVGGFIDYDRLAEALAARPQYNELVISGRQLAMWHAEGRKAEGVYA